METAKTLEEQVFEKLKEKQLRITTAESCTGGLLSAKLVNVSGISAYLKEAYVTYSDEAKKKLLGVGDNTLQTYTAVSRQTAEEMAKGGAKAANADICLSVTGVAGPDSEGADFPAGLVYIGCYYRGMTTVARHLFSGSRLEVRTQAADTALQLLLDTIEKDETI